MEPMTQAVSYEAVVGGEPTSGGWSPASTAAWPPTRPLRPLYPEEDLSGAEERLRLFLMQYWGGPHTYSDRRGHTRPCACATPPSPSARPSATPGFAT